MANIKSQIKRNRQNDKRRLRNRAVRGTTRVAVKSARTAIDAGVPESKEALMGAISALDKAAGKGVIHKNNAARRKSRLVKAFGKMEPAAAKVEPVAEPEAAPAKAEPKSGKKPAAAKTTKSTSASSSAKKTTASKSAAAKKPAAKSTSKAKKS